MKEKIQTAADEQQPDVPVKVTSVVRESCSHLSVIARSGGGLSTKTEKPGDLSLIDNRINYELGSEFIDFRARQLAFDKAFRAFSLDFAP